jgi:hypothetical protein
MRFSLGVTLVASVAFAAPVTSQRAATAVKQLDEAFSEPAEEGLTAGRALSADVLGNRSSLDTSVVVAVIQSRLQQVGVRAVADAIKSAGGPDSCRNYVRDLLDRASALLLAAQTSTVKRADMVELGVSVAQLAVTAAVVQIRFADTARVDAWVKAVNAVRDPKDPLKPEDARAQIEARLTEQAWLELADLFGRTPSTTLTCKDEDAVAKTVDAKAQAWLGIADIKTGLFSVASMARRRVIEPGPLLAALQVVPDLTLDQAGLDDVELAKLVSTGEAKMACVTEQLAALSKAATRLKATLSGKTDPNAGKADAKADAAALNQLLTVRADPNKPAACDPAQLIASLNTGKQLDALRLWAASLAVGGTGTGFSPAELEMLLNRAQWDTTVATLRDFTSLRQLGRDLAGTTQASGTLGQLPLDRLETLASSASALLQKLETTEAAARRVGLKVIADALEQLLGRLRGTSKLFAALTSAGTESGGKPATIGDLVKKVLGLQSGSGVPALLKLFAPVIQQLQAGKRIDEKLVLQVITSVDPDVFATAFRSDQGCFANSAALAWVQRIVGSIQVAFVQSDGKLVLDGDRLATTLAGVGDTFRASDQWHWFFHLTVGTGALYSNHSIDVSHPQTVPLIAEQIGFGWASPAFGGDRFTAKAGLFASGILYRIVLNNSESQAVMFGGFGAVDIYGLVEIFGAPLWLFYPPTATTPTFGSFGVAFGVQVPLGDYLARVAQKN